MTPNGKDITIRRVENGFTLHHGVDGPYEIPVEVARTPDEIAELVKTWASPNRDTEGGGDA